MAAAAILDFGNFKFLTVGGVKSIELRHRAKFRRTAVAISRFWIFQNGERRHLGFLKFKICNGRTRQEGRTASVCQMSSKSLEPWPRYMFQYYASLAWKCLFAPLLWVFWGAHSPEWCHSSPKKVRPWAEPCHLSHKARILVSRFELGIGTRKNDRTG